MQKKKLDDFRGCLLQPNFLVLLLIIEFNTEKSTCYSRVFVVTEFIVSMTEYNETVTYRYTA